VLIELDDSPTPRASTRARLHRGLVRLRRQGPRAVPRRRSGSAARTQRARAARRGARRRPGAAPRGRTRAATAQRGLAACRTQRWPTACARAWAADDPAQYSRRQSEEPGRPGAPALCEGTNLSRARCASTRSCTPRSASSRSRPSRGRTGRRSSRSSRSRDIAHAAWPRRPRRPRPLLLPPLGPQPRRGLGPRSAARSLSPTRRPSAPGAARDRPGRFAAVHRLAVGGIVLAGGGLLGAGVALRRRTRSDEH
jgi:hypothetical protein